MPVVVLSAEDNALIRMDGMDALSAAGLVAIAAEHAEHARAILEQDWISIHVLFSDVHMPPPAMTGLDLVREVHLRWPMIGLHLPRGCRFIPKPYSHRHVVGHIGELWALRSAL